MSQRIVTLCDAHQERDEEVTGYTWSVTIGAPGAKAATYEIDLCDDDGKGLIDLLAMLADLGRRVDGPGRPRKAPAAPTTAAAAAGSAGGKAAAAKAREGGPYPCPDCQAEFATPQGRGAHRSRAHGYRTAAASADSGTGE